MKRIWDIIRAIPLKRKIEAVTAVFLALAFFTTAHTYSWFNSQKKAAELFKVKYPDSLYINAAHREDQINFDLGQIGLDEYIYENGDFVYDENTGQPLKVSKKQYIFSISGTNTYEYILQLAHTNNNMFTYTIYEAEEYVHPIGTEVNATNSKYIVPAGTDPDNIITYVIDDAKHNENNMILAVDSYIASQNEENANNDSESMNLYYVKGSNLQMEYKNPSDSNNAYSLAKKEANGTYYPYGTNTNVEDHAVPSYKQKDVVLNENEDIDSNKQFCKYYILEVTWENRPSNIKNKETDLVYISVERVK